MMPRLLIAESDEGLADICRHYFCQRGFAVEVAQSGLQCLDAHQGRLPHALVLDYELPWGGGDGVLAQMREDGRLTSVPVFVITGSHQGLVSGSARKLLGGAPVVGCYGKPFRMESLWFALATEIPELAIKQFLEEAEYVLPPIQEQFGVLRRRCCKD